MFCMFACFSLVLFSSWLLVLLNYSCIFLKCIYGILLSLYNSWETSSILHLNVPSNPSFVLRILRNMYPLGLYTLILFPSFYA